MTKIEIMEDKSIEIINLAYQTSSQILTTLDNFITDIKNEKLQQLCADFVARYDLISDECKMLVKAKGETLDKENFFDKYQNLISLKISNLTKKTTFQIAEIIYVTLFETNPKLYSFLLFDDKDEISLIKKILSLNEEFANNLKPFFVCEWLNLTP